MVVNVGTIVAGVTTVRVNFLSVPSSQTGVIFDESPSRARVAVVALVSPEMVIWSFALNDALDTMETVIVFGCPARGVLWLMVFVEDVTAAAWTFEKQQQNIRTKNTACQRKERLIIGRLDWNVDWRKDTNRMVSDTIVNESARLAFETLWNPLRMSAIVSDEGKVGNSAAVVRVLAVVNAADNVAASQSWTG
jgi:hypothetical protein